MILVLVCRILFGTLRQYLLAIIGRKVDLTLVSAYRPPPKGPVAE